MTLGIAAGMSSGVIRETGSLGCIRRDIVELVGMSGDTGNAGAVGGCLVVTIVTGVACGCHMLDMAVYFAASITRWIAVAGATGDPTT